jgi:hypothetical protein
VLEVQAMLEPFKGDLNSPPLMVKVAEGGGRKVLGVEGSITRLSQDLSART